MSGGNFAGGIFFTLKTDHFVGNSRCWMHGSLDANHYHIFWDCPYIKMFLGRHPHCFRKGSSLDTSIDFRFEVLYLARSQWSPGKVEANTMCSILASSKKAITR